MRAIIDLHSSAYLTAIGISPQRRDDAAHPAPASDPTPDPAPGRPAPRQDRFMRLARFIRLVARASAA